MVTFCFRPAVPAWCQDGKFHTRLETRSPAYPAWLPSKYDLGLEQASLFHQHASSNADLPTHFLTLANCFRSTSALLPPASAGQGFCMSACAWDVRANVAIPMLLADVHKQLLTQKLLPPSFRHASAVCVRRIWAELLGI